MSTNIDFSTIEHLDFDVNIEPKEPCKGYRWWVNGIIQFDNLGQCEREAKVVTVRGCCGLIEYYCVECYNQIIVHHATAEVVPNHTPVGTTKSHPIRGAVFSQVNFL